ncbi:MAG: heavy metal translocating P-type ATPase metal-binding domain-containing protein, partial [Alphaproteobacteria bacterium]
MAACAHCGEAVANASGDGPAFCCAGCGAAHGLIRGLGLGAYYARRSIDPAARPPRPEDHGALDPTPFVRAGDDGTCRVDLMVDGLHCAACVWLIESVLTRLPGVVAARVNLSTRRLALAWHGVAADAARLVGAVTALGYRLVPYDPARLDAAESRAETTLLRAMAVAGFAAANVMLLSVAVWSGQASVMGPATRDLLHWFSALVALPAIAYAGRPFFGSAWAVLRHGRTNMDVPISIGVALTAGMSLFETARGGEHVYFDSTVALLFFLLVGRYLDARARGTARSAAGQVLALEARAATVLDDDGRARAVVPQDVPFGARVLVAAGERIPVDGTVLVGSGLVDTSLVTGESAPARLGTGDSVFAGTLNLEAPLTVRARAVGAATLLADIARTMEAAVQGRARHVALADRVARRYAPVVHTLALATFLGWTFIGDVAWQAALLNAVAVLIITCPCALALAVPAVQVVATGRLMRMGILVKSPTALERLAHVDTVVLDKTGTLSRGRPEPDLALVDAGALRIAAALAMTSRHPLARALARAAPGVVPLAGVTEIPGEGLCATLDDGEARLGRRSFCRVAEDEAGDGPELWLARPGARPLRIGFHDPPRADAAEVVAALGRRGLAVELMSGDRTSTVAAAMA